MLAFSSCCVYSCDCFDCVSGDVLFSLLFCLCPCCGLFLNFCFFAFVQADGWVGRLVNLHDPRREVDWCELVGALVGEVSVPLSYICVRGCMPVRVRVCLCERGRDVLRPDVSMSCRQAVTPVNEKAIPGLDGKTEATRYVQRVRSTYV